MRRLFADKNVKMAFTWGLITGTFISGIMVLAFAYGVKSQMEFQKGMVHQPGSKITIKTKVMVKSSFYNVESA